MLLLAGAGAFAAFRAVLPAPPEAHTNRPLQALPDVLADVSHSLLRVPGAAPESAFGLIGEVARARDGRTYVLDAINREVGVFAPSGERTAVLGGAGAGPGEFLGPIALAVDEASDGLYVLDERRQGIDRFSLERGTWQRTIPLDFHAGDLCFLDGRLYVLGGRNGFLLHEVSPEDGRVLRSFAPDADSREVLLSGYRGSGYLGCAPSGEIAFLPGLRPQVTRFSAERGETLGSAPIPGYKAVRVHPVSGGGMRFDVPGGGGHDYGSSVLPLPDGDWLIQVGRLKPGTSSHHEFISVRSYRLSGRDGQIHALSVHLPRVMASDDGGFYTVDTSPHPTVRVVRAPLAELLR
jgi:hypothetical protein